MKPRQWHAAIRCYVLMVAGLNFLWEMAQLPFYTIWQTGTWKTIAVAVLHCTAGDLVIAITALIVCLTMFGNSEWPRQRFYPVAISVLIAGLAYTIYSERSNIASGAWTYAELMPVIPWLDVGLTPLLQWLLIPSVCLWRMVKPTPRLPE